MGNSVSSSTNCFLHVNEPRTLTAGSIISGEVRCPDRSISNGIFARGVKLYFTGKEDVEVGRTGGAGDVGSNMSKKATHEIVRIVIPVDAPRDAASAGRCYPFQFHIPDRLPSSMFFRDENGGHCSIRYKVKMRVMKGTDQEIPITIVAKPPSAAPMPNRAGRVQRITFLRCIPQGSVSWSAGVYDDRVGVGENLVINLAVKNNSWARLERVSAELEETVEWRTSRRHSSKVSRTYDPHPSNFKLSKSKRPRRLTISSRAKKTQGTEGPTSQAGQHEAYFDTEREDNNQVVTFPIPEYVCQSYSGRLIKIRHCVRIKAKTPTFYTSPKIHIPIEVVCPRDVPIVAAMLTPEPSAPPLWSEPDQDYSLSTPAPHIASTPSAVVVGEITAMATPTPCATHLRSESDHECSSSSDTAACISSTPSVVVVGARVNKSEGEACDVPDTAALVSVVSEQYDCTLDGLTIMPPPFHTTLGSELVYN
jgi:hypothetical protein